MEIFNYIAGILTHVMIILYFVCGGFVFVTSSTLLIKHLNFDTNYFILYVLSAFVIWCWIFFKII